MSDIYLQQEGAQTGPYQPAQVRQFLAEGRISGETLAWHEGLAEWTTVAAVLAAFPASVPPPPPAPMPSFPPVVPVKKKTNGCLIAAIIAGAALVGLFVLSCVAGVALGPITAGIKMAQENASMQVSRTLGLAMYQYAQDNHGAYPDGATSTEVFQKLMDGNYISDGGIFYLAMPGKTKWTSGKLTANNVCFDVTSGVIADSSDSVPVVFCTGYTVTYAPGADAVRDAPVATPFPGPGEKFIGLAVTYKDNSAHFLHGDADGTVHNFIPAAFDSGGKTYRQLKP
jgi:hypothetical protein